MNLQKTIIASLLALGLSAGAAQADVIKITANQDATIGGNYNNSSNIWYRWVAGTGYFAIFGFDVSSLAGKTIKSVDFSAYHNYDGAPSLIGASVGTNNSWSDTTVVNYSGLGAVLDTKTADGNSLYNYQTWHLGAQAFDGGSFTVALTDLGNGWNDYEPLNARNGHAAYLSVEVETSKVPEPATLGLLALGVAGIGCVRRRKAA